jgi:hypothetical protein
MNGGGFFPYNLLWLASATQAVVVEPLPLDAHYPGGSDVAVFRSAWGDPHALFLGVKGGTPMVSHSHLDLGSFVLDADGVRWSSELGSDDYALPDYFGKKRFTYLRLNNLGHSTLIINDALQSQGAIAPIRRFVSGATASGAVLDLGSAHPDLVDRWTRQIWMLDRNRLLVQDDLTGLPDQAALRWQMVTRAEVAVAEDGRRAVLRQQGKTLEAEILTPADATFAWTTLTPETAAEAQNADYGLLIATLPPVTAGHDVRILIRLRPVGGSWPAEVPADIARESMP